MSKLMKAKVRRVTSLSRAAAFTVVVGSYPTPFTQNIHLYLGKQG